MPSSECVQNTTCSFCISQRKEKVQNVFGKAAGAVSNVLSWCSLPGPGWVEFIKILSLFFLHHNLSFVAVWRLPKPHVADVDVLSAKQTLLVSWLVNHRSLLGATSEVQISRSENHTIVYSVSQEGFTLFTLCFQTLNNLTGLIL